MDPRNPDALLPLTEKSFKYKFEATIPEPDVCTDCILARITVINVIASDYGVYVLRATSEQYTGYSYDGRVKLYRKYTRHCFLFKSIKHYTTFFFLFKKHPNANSRLQIQITKAAEVRPQLSYHQPDYQSNAEFSAFVNVQKYTIYLFQLYTYIYGLSLNFLNIFFFRCLTFCLC